MRDLLLTSSAIGRSFPRIAFAPDGAAGPDGQIDVQASSILSLLGDDDDGGADAAAAAVAGEAQDTTDTAVGSDAADDGQDADAAQAAAAADTATGDEADPAAEEAQPESPIEPPVSWKADAKERFKKLPREDQKYILARESEREAALTRAQQEAAETRRKAEEIIRAEREALAKERQQTSERIAQAYRVARTANPIIAAGDALGVEGWRQLYAQHTAEAAARRSQYEMEVNALNAQFDAPLKAVQAADAAAQEQAAKERAEAEAKARAEYRAKLQADEHLGPIIKDEQKRKQLDQQMAAYLTGQGYTPEQINGTTDPRAVIMAWKAMEYDRLQAEQKTIGDKKVQPKPARVLRPQAQTDADGGANPKAKTLLNKARSTRDVRAQAEYLMELIG